MPPPDSPSPPEPGSGGRSGSSGPGEPDPLEELTRRVRAAQEAADRVIAEAGAATRAGTASGDRPPARGYAGPEGDERDGRSAEARALLGLLDLGRGLMPAELRHALADLVRELLMLLRALIDWYLERLELRRREPVDVEDIPIS